jgi:signal peptidase I
MIFDFSFILVVATLVTGIVWGLDSWLFKPKRVAAVRAAERARNTAANVSASTAENVQAAKAPDTADAVPEPVVVEYARSFFPVILIVLLIRSFLFEPFRIPSDSMMPTLLDGDFIFVNKYSYGLRLPVVNRKIVSLGEPKRGDVIVFRLPSDPSTNYIKRLVGLPGDHVVVRERRLFVNDVEVPVSLDGIYSGHRHDGARIGDERLGDAEHNVLYLMDRQPKEYNEVVPAGHYFFMGDNRDNSRDSRFEEVGFVPERNLVGKAVRIWLNWDWPDAPIWDRIGDPIR